MRLLRIAPVLLMLLTAWGCGVNRRLNAPLGDGAAPMTLNRGLGTRLYTLNNAPSGNAVLAFERRDDGTLEGPVATPTGGNGTGAGLGSQGALIASIEDRELFAVDAGSNDVAALRITPNGLQPLGITPSGGERPISLTRSGRLLFVLNAGGNGGIAGFRIGADGRLSLIAGSVHGLGGNATAPAQISFTPDGAHLLVTEKAANAIAVYDVAANGSVSEPHVFPSSGMTPFGFAFARSNAAIVSEAAGGSANGSSASSYHVGAGSLMLVSGSVPTHQTAACWVAVSPGGEFAYTTNAGSNSISGFHVGSDGSLALLDADGHTATADGSPIDGTFDRSGDYLYVLNAAAHSVNGYQRQSDGHLVPVQGAGGLPVGTVGLAAF